MVAVQRLLALFYGETQPDKTGLKPNYVTENHGVGGSIPPLGTSISLKSQEKSKHS
jgi:hypothetical protein